MFILYKFVLSLVSHTGGDLYESLSRKDKVLETPRNQVTYLSNLTSTRSLGSFELLGGSAFDKYGKTSVTPWLYTFY